MIEMFTDIFSLSMLTIVIALLYDALVGDPRWLPHPVIGIGKIISTLEKRLYGAGKRAERSLLFRGMVLSLLTVGITFAVSAAVMALVQWANLEFVPVKQSGTVHFLDKGIFIGSGIVQALGGGILLGIALAGRCLAEAAFEIKDLLEAGEIVEARRKLSWIVGRDTEQLDESEIVRATVETVAENTVDGITSPLFYAFLLGVPGAYAYKAVNTLDSMIGYRNDRYLWFGRFAARMDDVANFLPARLTGVVMILAGTLLGYPAGRMIQTWVTDAPKHPSPNSGIPESVVAGALGVQLGGLNYYGGVPSRRATMGQPLVTLEARHIGEVVRIMAVTAILYSLAGGAILYGIGTWLR
ncbi:adenosylcobinamide-phosphate synthase CbiB [Heliobacterium mobile]|nr:adenosylcobinamide-phosphate synthase CbiB [Heliobacterium mobile]